MRSHFKHLIRDENTLLVTFVLTLNLWLPPELLLQLTRPSARAPHRGRTAPRVFFGARWVFHFFYYHYCHRGRRAARALSRPRGTSVNDPSEIDDKARQHLFCGICNVQGVQKNSSLEQTKMAKHGTLVNILKWSKGIWNGKPRCFWQFGTLLGASGHFWTISDDKNQFVAP